ncbi:thioredoxin [Mesoplasma coleopterae]|uniref:Thioredoxin n=1 Tax=Mesoplasma coleopterae TaxID=324078 RepID=A0A2K8P1V8_9MOLU|nr:thioredoxin [Mesoplasma coleopterae]ATZ20709.1 thioredoxin [Mesoplasma coleopterae]AVN62222.1 thioredoxin [Mesoplasma coleopterae]AVN62890.1 thioredoxin [Mesoplasma coleopterae]
MAEMIKVSSKEEFDKIISEGKTFVDFNATWCGPCKMQMPLVHMLAQKTEGIKFIDLDVDLVPEVAQQYQVMSIPTLMLFEEGKEAKKNVGFMDPTKLENFIK